MHLRRLPSAMFLALSAACFVLLTAGIARAEQFKNCQAKYNANDYRGAYACYKALWRTEKSLRVAANLGNVEVELGKFREAIPHLEFVLDNVPVGELRRAEILDKTGRKLADAKQHVAIIHLELSPPVASVTLNGAIIGTSPLAEPLILDPGTYALAAARDGYNPLNHNLVAQAGQEPTIKLDMLPTTAGGPSGPRPPGDSTVSPAMIGISIATGVLALGAIGAGVGLLVAAGNKADERQQVAADIGNNSTCSDPTNNDTRCDQIAALTSDEDTFNGAGIGMLVAGGVLAVGTVLVIVLWPKSSTSATSLHVAPTPGGVTFGGTF